MSCRGVWLGGVVQVERWSWYRYFTSLQVAVGGAAESGEAWNTWRKTWHRRAQQRTGSVSEVHDSFAAHLLSLDCCVCVCVCAVTWTKSCVIQHSCTLLLSGVSRCLLTTLVWVLKTTSDRPSPGPAHTQAKLEATVHKISTEIKAANCNYGEFQHPVSTTQHYSHAGLESWC